MRFILLLVAVFCGLAGISSRAEGSTWGFQSLAAFSESYPSLYFGNRGDMVLMEGGFPCVVYLDRSSGYRLHCVEWVGGRRRDDVMFPVEAETAAVRIAANGEHLSVSWMVWQQSISSGVIKHSRRVDGVWTAPEVVQDGASVWDLSVAEDGTPAAAIYLRSGRTVRWMERGESGWISSTIAQTNLTLSNIEVIRGAGGQPTVAWRAYSIYSGGGTYIRYAMRNGGVWTPGEVPQLTLLSCLFPGPDGVPLLIGRTAGQVSLLYRLSPGNPGAAETIPYGLAESIAAVTLPDGTLHVVDYDRMLTRGGGGWSESRCPISHAILADPAGNLHLLGVDGTVLQYSTQLPADPPPLHQFFTYEQGGGWLDDLVIHPDGHPRIFAWPGSGPALEYSGAGTSWSAIPVRDLSPGWLYAFDSTGRRHAYYGGSVYAVEDDLGVMETSSIPVSVNTFNSGSIYAFLMDSGDASHIGFYTGVGTSSVAVRYGVRRGGTWTIETVAEGESSDQHCALALDPAGQPWMFTTRGLFRRTSSGWRHEYETSRISGPGLGIASDGTVHAVFVSGGFLHYLTGKDGQYATEVLGLASRPDVVPGFAMAGDIPLLACWKQLTYSPARHAIILAGRSGGGWWQRFITQPSTTLEAGQDVMLTATADGRWTIAGHLRETRSSTIRDLPFVCQGRLGADSPAMPPVIQMPLPQGGRRFQISLGVGPVSRPLLLQGSSSLDSWSPLIRLGPELRAYPGVEGAGLRGDPFRTRITYDAPAGTQAWFVRLKEE